MMFGRDQPRIDFQAAFADREIVIAAAERDAAHLFHAQAPTLRAVFDGELLEQDHAVRNRMQLQIGFVRGEIVEQNDRAIADARNNA